MNMPYIGEIRRVYEIKATKQHYKCIWIACEKCGKERWVILRHGKPQSTVCFKCALRPGKPRKGKTLICPICGKEFYAMPGEVIGKVGRKPRQYCSKACHDKAQIKEVTLHCKVCGKEYTRRPSEIKWRGSSFCSLKCRGKWITIAESGPNSPTWQGGKSSESHRLRASKAWADWRNAIFERDNYTCQMCGDRNGNGHTVTLHPHHIQPFADYPELRFDINNGMTLCTKCHALHTAWQNLGGLSLRHEKRKKRKTKNSQTIR